jgi:hypothetical protein
MILDELARHPSNIARSAIEYLQTIKVAPKTRRLYEDVLTLFVDSLLSDPSAVIETDEGEYLLKYDWDAYYGGAISGFLDWWLPRKWMGSDAIPARAPGILRRWVKWCFQNDYFEKERYEDLLDALPRGKSAEVKRLQKAGELLYGLHQPNPGAWMTGEYDKIVAIDARKRPQEYDEGYMRIVRLEKSSAYLENVEGKERGPVMLGQGLVKLLKVGDVINVVIGRFGKSWKVLESGNVYAEGTIY